MKHNIIIQFYLLSRKHVKVVKK